jgi:hypothetical protein
MGLGDFIECNTTRYATVTWITSSASFDNTNTFTATDSTGTNSVSGAEFGTGSTRYTTSDTSTQNGEAGGTTVIGDWYTHQSGRTIGSMQSGYSGSAYTSYTESGQYTTSTSTTSTLAIGTTVTIGGITFTSTTSTTDTVSIPTSASSSTDNATDTNSSTSYDVRGTNTTYYDTTLYVPNTVWSTILVDIEASVTSTFSTSEPTTSTTTVPTTTIVGGTHTTTTAVGATLTTTSYTFSNTTTSADTSASSVMSGSAVTVTLTDGRPIEICNPTYYVLPNQVAWIITVSDTSDRLRMLSDIAMSVTDSFTIADETSTYDPFNGTVTDLAVSVSYNPVVEISASSGVDTLTISTTTNTTATLTTFDHISLSTTTINTTTGTTTTQGNPWQVNTTTVGTVTLSVDATTVSSVTDEFASTTTGLTEVYDDLGRKTGFTTLILPTIYTTTYNVTTAAQTAARELSTTASTGTSAGLTGHTTSAIGGVGASAVLWYGATTAQTGPMEVLAPARPEGACLPIGDISVRRPHDMIGAGGMFVPAIYGIGQQGSIFTPVPYAYYTTTDSTGGSYTLSFSSISVTVTKGTLAGTSTITSKLTGALTQSGEHDDTFWDILNQAGFTWNAFGGGTPDGRDQYIAYGRGLYDVTNLDPANNTDTINPQEASSFNNPSGTAGSALNYLPVWDVWPGRDQAFALPLYAGDNP